MTGNKKKEKQKKEAHLDRLNAARAKRSSAPILIRSSPSIDEKETFLIVCKGKNTEPSYFKKFRLTSAKITTIGNGYNTISLVEDAIALQMKGNYDQVWCVFDMDSNSPNNFNSAISLATSNNFGVAYSNQAFEYWLILHFEDHQGGRMDRSEYDAKLNRYINQLGATYDGDASKTVSDKLFCLLNGRDPVTHTKRVNLAISRAKRNYALFNHSSPALKESSTTVYSLVEEILKFV